MRVTKRKRKGEVHISIVLEEGEVVHNLDQIFRKVVEDGPFDGNKPRIKALVPLKGILSAATVTDLVRKWYSMWAHVEKVEYIETHYIVHINRKPYRVYLEENNIPEEGMESIEWDVTHTEKRTWLG